MPTDLAVPDALKRALAAGRARAIHDSFGGPNMHRLLCERNPEFTVILNAGILAGMELRDADLEASVRA